VVAEDEEEAKLRAEAEKIGIRTLAVVNTDANVLLVTGHVLALALVPVGVDIPNI
jgi:ribosomal protein S2